MEPFRDQTSCFDTVLALPFQVFAVATFWTHRRARVVGSLLGQQSSIHTHKKT